MLDFKNRIYNSYREQHKVWKIQTHSESSGADFNSNIDEINTW